MREGRWVMAELRGKGAPPPSPVSVQQGIDVWTSAAGRSRGGCRAPSATAAR